MRLKCASPASSGPTPCAWRLCRQYEPGMTRPVAESERITSTGMSTLQGLYQLLYKPSYGLRRLTVTGETSSRCETRSHKLRSQGEVSAESVGEMTCLLKPHSLHTISGRTVYCIWFPDVTVFTEVLYCAIARLRHLLAQVSMAAWRYTLTTAI